MDTEIKEKQKLTEAVILCYNLHDKKGEVKLNDLVCIDDDFYNIVKIDPRYKVNKGEPDNKFKYFVKSKINDELMNFSREEISKAGLAYFYAEPYFENNVKKFICAVPLNNESAKRDINYIKAKFACEWDMGASELKDIPTQHLHELTINGFVKEHQRDVMYHTDMTQPNFKSFKVDIK